MYFQEFWISNQRLCLHLLFRPTLFSAYSKLQEASFNGPFNSSSPTGMPRPKGVPFWAPGIGKVLFFLAGRMWKGYLFRERYLKGLQFSKFSMKKGPDCSKFSMRKGPDSVTKLCIWKGEGSGSRAEHSRIKSVREPLPSPRGLKLFFTQRKCFFNIKESFAKREDFKNMLFFCCISKLCQRRQCQTEAIVQQTCYEKLQVAMKLLKFHMVKFWKSA